MFGADYARESVKKLYYLSQQLVELHTDYKDSREFAFVKWSGEEKDKARLKADDLDQQVDPVLEMLKSARYQLLQWWAREVDGYNQSIYEAELAMVEDALDAHWEETRAHMREEGDLVDKVSASGPVFLLVKSVDAMGVNVLHDDAEHVVDKPRLIEEDESSWPQSPLFEADAVFLYYTGSRINRRRACYSNRPATI